MATQPLTFTVPEDLQGYVAARMETQSFSNPTEYFRDLVLTERAKRLSELEATLLKAMEEEAIEIPEDVLDGGDLDAFLRQALKEREKVR